MRHKKSCLINQYEIKKGSHYFVYATTLLIYKCLHRLLSRIDFQFNFFFKNQLVGLDNEIREETLRLNAERDEQILALQREEKQLLQHPKFQRKAPSYCTGPR